MNRFIKINEKDNCLVALEEIKEGYTENGVTANNDIPFGHKIAACDIKKGENVIKYGYPIGHATENISKGDHIHSHNLKTNLEATKEYEYQPMHKEEQHCETPLYFNGYKRSDSRVGIRNEIWVIPTVGCANDIARRIANNMNIKAVGNCDGVFAFCHPYGCSQLGGDLRATQNALCGLVKNGNAAAVLIVSLGCENNNLSEFMPLLAGLDKSRIRTLNCQQSADEIADGEQLIEELMAEISTDKRTKLPVSELTVGFKCGGSDAFSGLTANPLCGRFCDRFTSLGGKAMLTEVPEMFGAESILVNRAVDENIFNNFIDMINGFKQYFTSHNQPVYENPSPGNKQGGITTLEEKSLGCVQKGGTSTITDILLYGEQCKKSGLSLLTGPGNDIVSCTNLTASGANIIIFTTGRGTPLGAPVPTVKVSTNSQLYKHKPGWIDYNAGEILNGKSFDEAEKELLDLIISVASGETRTKNEQNNYREIAIFKDGVTL